MYPEEQERSSTRRRYDARVSSMAPDERAREAERQAMYDAIGEDYEDERYGA